MRSITPKQIESLATAQQYFHDCYILSSLGMLSRSPKGQKILKNNKTRTIPQIRSHAQKYLIRLCGKYSIKLSFSHPPPIVKFPISLQ